MYQQLTVRACGVLGGALLLCSCGSDTLLALQTVKDEFVQNTAAMVDILWVVDNSSSMGEEQNGLAQSFDAFINNLVLSGVDYHVGVVATDTADGALHAPNRCALGSRSLCQQDTDCGVNGPCVD
ncbi:MAG: VWA domain-containing protein, partial [Deltaproteobacteria bacterium]|nr:VWA domain-containing protein [Deltaproteobacteria bacterium]